MDLCCLWSFFTPPKARAVFFSPLFAKIPPHVRTQYPLQGKAHSAPLHQELVHSQGAWCWLPDAELRLCGKELCGGGKWPQRLVNLQEERSNWYQSMDTNEIKSYKEIEFQSWAVMAHACNTSIWEVEPGESRVQGHPLQNCQFYLKKCDSKAW